MKIIIDLDPKLQRKLEVVANARRQSVSDVVADLLARVLTRDPSSSSSGEGIPSPAAADAAKKPVVPVATAGPGLEEIILLLEPLISRFRLTDGDGSQRRALLAEMKMLPQEPTVTRLGDLIRSSLG
jgi:hypothetical protein